MSELIIDLALLATIVVIVAAICWLRGSRSGTCSSPELNQQFNESARSTEYSEEVSSKVVGTVDRDIQPPAHALEAARFSARVARRISEDGLRDPADVLRESMDRDIQLPAHALEAARFSARVARRISEDELRDPVDALRDSERLLDLMLLIHTMISNAETRYALRERVIEDLGCVNIDEIVARAKRLVDANTARLNSCLRERAVGTGGGVDVG